MEDRYAIYFAPEEGSALAELGEFWLGRNNDLTAPPQVPELDGLDPAVWQELTEVPRLYGFHATLKPPFNLESRYSREYLVAYAMSFAASVGPITLPKLKLVRKGKFFALVPDGDFDAVRKLSDRCVQEFDEFRSPQSLEDEERRRKAGLTPNQTKMLEKWGYPYVFEEFEFHMTLTNAIEDQELADQLEKILTPLVEKACEAPIVVKEICLFYQEGRSVPFKLIERLPLG
ncbi:MAG: DUF1045 domain-containing protein [Desulfovibrio sp.]